MSRIDGNTPWTLLREIGGLPPEEVDRCLARWLSEGLLEIDGQKPEDVEERLDPGLDLPEDLQRRILAYEASLDRSYYELLDVPRDADGKAIKRAYFRLSREFHPDRYFRRNIGPFLPRLEEIFKKVVEAYELLSDPATRTEIDRMLGPAPPPRKAAPPPPSDASDPAATPRPAGPAPRPRGAPPPKFGKRERLERLRRQFRIPEEVLAERRFKARQFFQASRLAAGREKWLEAAASVRLAIAFDPWNDEYKRGFAEVQARVNQMRADDLLAQAGDSESQAEALRLYEEALHFRPNDPAAQGRAALLAIEVGDLEKAHEFASDACELDPETAAHHVTLARVLRRLGRRDAARAALKRASELDPRSPEVRTEQEALRRHARSR